MPRLTIFFKEPLSQTDKPNVMPATTAVGAGTIRNALEAIQQAVADAPDYFPMAVSIEVVDDAGRTVEARVLKDGRWINANAEGS